MYLCTRATAFTHALSQLWQVVVTGAIGGHLPNSSESYKPGEEGQANMASLHGIDYANKRWEALMNVAHSVYE